MAKARRREHERPGAWPGYVDMLSTLLLVIVFLLILFGLAQFVLSADLVDRKRQLAQATTELEERNRELSRRNQELLNARSQLSDLASELALTSEQARTSALELDNLTREHQTLLLSLERSESLRRDLEATVGTSDDELRLALLDAERLRRDIRALTETRHRLEGEISRLVEQDNVSRRDIGALRDRARQLEARLADEEERTLLAQTELGKREIRLQELQALYLETERLLGNREEEVTASAAEIGLLNSQIARLRDELGQVSALLADSQARDASSQARIADLGQQLNRALAGRVGELIRYRSVFFEKLQKALQGRDGVSVQGDRFVLQAEVLFASGSDILSEQAAQDLRTLAETLVEVAADIPDNVRWVLRVDGHTDRTPLRSESQFASNWHLSAARAIRVVQFLVSRNVPPGRLVAAGFGEFHPLAEGSDPAALARNRRIEFKLTER